MTITILKVTLEFLYDVYPYPPVSYSLGSIPTTRTSSFQPR